MEIGGIKIINPVFLAPMAGVSDFPYRQIIREMGCELLYTEMVSSKGLVYGNSRTGELLEHSTGKRGKIAVQLFGEDPSFMSEAARLVAEEVKPDFIDINMGCPTAKIVKNGSGSALMKTPVLAGKVITAVVEAVEIPVTFKIRKGWDQSSVNAVEIARRGEEAGAAAVAVHGRTREQFYSGEADWEIIGRVKEEVAIPVIGNGDIFEPEDAARMIAVSGCDAVMIGRGARGNPWLLKRTAHYLLTGELLPEPGYRERVDMALYHLEQAVSYYPAENAVKMMRKHFGWYLKGMPGAAEMRNRINLLTTPQEVRAVLIDYLQEIEVER